MSLGLHKRGAAPLRRRPLPGDEREDPRQVHHPHGGRLRRLRGREFQIRK